MHREIWILVLDVTFEGTMRDCSEEVIYLVLGFLLLVIFSCWNFSLLLFYHVETGSLLGIFVILLRIMLVVDLSWTLCWLVFWWIWWFPWIFQYCDPWEGVVSPL